MKVLSLLIFLCACGTSNNGESAATGDTIRVKIQKSFTIKLATSMGTGYKWSPVDSSYTKNMSLDSVTVINNTEGKEDGADLQVFHFKALVKSTTQLDFVHKRSWESRDKADKERKFTVIIE